MLKRGRYRKRIDSTDGAFEATLSAETLSSHVARTRANGNDTTPWPHISLSVFYLQLMKSFLVKITYVCIIVALMVHTALLLYECSILSLYILYMYLYIFFCRAVIFCVQTPPAVCLQWTQNSALLQGAARGVS